MTTTRVALGLGANLGNPIVVLKRAIAELPLTGKKTSSLYESEAMLPPHSPPEWAQPFFNLVLVGDFAGDPESLLASCKSLERKLGRLPRDRWAPREIDIDILCFGALSFRSDALELPHPGLIDRPFALLPLAEVWPDWTYPKQNEFYLKTAHEIAARWNSSSELPYQTRKSSHAL